jgi:hypothetical protein
MDVLCIRLTLEQETTSSRGLNQHLLLQGEYRVG